MNGENESPSLEAALIPGPDGFIHPFGLSQDTHMASKRAFAHVNRQGEGVEILKYKLESLKDDFSPNVIQSTLTIEPRPHSGIQQQSELGLDHFAPHLGHTQAYCFDAAGRLELRWPG